MKRFAAILLAMGLGLGILTGCGGGTDDGAKTEETAGSEAEKTEDGGKTEEGKDEGNSDAASAKFGSPDDPVTITYLCKDLSPADEDVIAFCDKLYEDMSAEGMYIKLEVLEAPAGTYGEVVPLAVRTGQITPDIIYFQGGDLAVSQEELLTDLTPYIENSTYVKALMQDFNKTRMENYPYLVYLTDIAVKAPVIRTDILSKLTSGQAVLDDPTIDNYYNMFKEIVEGGHSKYAFTTDGSLARLDSVFNHAFGVTSTIMEQDGEWVYGKTTEFEKNKLEFYAKLYAEGLLDPEYITKGWEEMEQSFYTGETSIIMGTSGQVIEVYNTKMVGTMGEEAILQALPPASGVSQSFESIDVTKETRGRSIHADCENKDAAWAVLEYMASPEGRKLDLLGVEGIHYNIENNQIVRTDLADRWWSRFFNSTVDFNPEPPLAKPLLSKPAQDTLDLANKYAKEDINIIVPDEMAASWDAMDAIYKDFAVDVVRGERPISDFDTFVTEWNAAGGTAFSEYLKTVLK